MAEDGASPSERVLEACRRNNTELLAEVLSATQGSRSKSAEEAIAELLNGTRDAMGNPALHVAATAGSYDVLDVILDQPGVETDPLDRQTQSTPLHKAVEYANALGPAAWSTEGHAIVEILVDAGCDPRIRNKAKRRPIDAVDPRNDALRQFLARAEMMLTEGEGIVDDDADEDGGGHDPPSDSD